jgi:glycosyltransferase involved in cell wall biosynthesis
MRVLQLVDSLAPAGAEQSLVALAPHLVSRGVELHVGYLLERDGLRDQLAAVNVPVHAVGGGSRARWPIAAADLMSQLRPELVHTTLFEADLAGRLAAARHRIPVVSSLANTAYGRTEVAASGLPRSRVVAAQLADATTARLVSRFHAVTPHVADVMSRRLAVRRSKVDVVFRGRDPERLGRRSAERQAAVRRRLGIGDDTPLVIAVARQERQKGLDVLLHALPSLLARRPSLVVLVAGREGNATPDLRRLVDDLGVADAVTFLGARDDVPDLLAAADVFAFPSRWEGAAGTILEALALECPIVCTDLATLSGTVDGATARLVPVDDPAALAAAVGHVLAAPHDAAERSRAGRRHFEGRFTIDASADGMVALYQRAAAGSAWRRLPLARPRPARSGQ